MHLASSLFQITEGGYPEHFDAVRQAIDPQWIEAALQATGTATLRKRRLPAEQVIWLVLGMALFRDRSIIEVAAKLDLALPGSRGVTAAPSSVCEARSRLGEEPLAWLFDRCALAWARRSADTHRWRGLALYGIDGTSVRVPDSSANRTHFGGHRAGGDRGDSGYPLVRLVALMTLRSHLIEAVRFGPFTTDERRYAADLFAALPERSLLIVDRNFYAAAPLVALQATGGERHWLMRMRKRTRYRVLEQFSDGDALVEVRVAPKARQRNPSLPKTFPARMVGYQRPGHARQVLLSSLLDPQAYPAEEIAALYHERWEIELGYDELKTELLEQEETLRSQSPAAVAQEIWGLLLAYNLVRVEMERVAEEAQVEPVRISFVAALRLIRDEWLWCAVASPGAIPRHLKRLRQDLKHFILPKRRSGRSYPRAVKRKMSHYPRKRPSLPPPPP
jgi:hypothetical protein